jgi:hypothetical protein
VSGQQAVGWKDRVDPEWVLTVKTARCNDRGISPTHSDHSRPGPECTPESPPSRVKTHRVYGRQCLQRWVIRSAHWIRSPLLRTSRHRASCAIGRFLEYRARVASEAPEQTRRRRATRVRSPSSSAATKAGFRSPADHAGIELHRAPRSSVCRDPRRDPKFLEAPPMRKASHGTWTSLPLK